MYIKLYDNITSLITNHADEARNRFSFDIAMVTIKHDD